MTTQTRRSHRALGRTITVLAGALATVTVVAVPASAATSSDRIPAAGAPVTCSGVGTLTATSGYLRQRGSTTVDGQGHAHVLFTISAEQVLLSGSDGATYRLVGAGFDSVVYPTDEVTGDVVREQEDFSFDVVGRHGVVGVVRFRLHTGSDQVPHVQDSSICQLPNMS